ncbi:hypothetical protein ADUPG1_012164 [Aduncisulcus paluster]|uniref:Uncharacterized protein n=1 Tax=Aduncisulcus paluster TaxID=2918883 RepID=A0ABQ5K2B0_9EUKA|nr:hypothetical protein ADUPG1_012164 [Aduncisulcus paluster]
MSFSRLFSGHFPNIVSPAAKKSCLNFIKKLFEYEHPKETKEEPTEEKGKKKWESIATKEKKGKKTPLVMEVEEHEDLEAREERRLAREKERKEKAAKEEPKSLPDMLAEHGKQVLIGTQHELQESKVAEQAVSCVSWHPEKKGLFCYSAYDQTVGIGFVTKL